jgi:hypothetical protein
MNKMWIIAVPPYVERMASSIWLKDKQIRNELKNTLSKQFECPIAKSKIQKQNQYIDDAYLLDLGQAIQ